MAERASQQTTQTTGTEKVSLQTLLSKAALPLIHTATNQALTLLTLIWWWFALVSCFERICIYCLLI